MTQRISGPGLGLPLPQGLYPSYLNNAPVDANSNRIALQPDEHLTMHMRQVVSAQTLKTDAW